MSAKEIILLRHGSTGFDGRYVGTTDVSITDEAKTQITNRLKSLRSMNPDLILCSPMRRCRETLQALQIPREAEFLEALKEIDFGHWELKNFTEIQEEEPETVDQWLDSPATFCFPKGECFATFTARIEMVYRRLVQSSESRIMVVSHGGVIRYLLCHLLGLSKENYGAFEVQAGTYSRVILRDSIGSLLSFNSLH